MPNLPKGTHVADCECFTCGKPVKVKLNKNGTAYYFCPWVNVETGNRCNDQHRFGVDESQAMQRDYIATRKSQPKPQEMTHEHEIKPVQQQAQDDTGEGDTGRGHPAAGRTDNGSGDGWGLYG